MTMAGASVLVRPVYIGGSRFLLRWDGCRSTRGIGAALLTVALATPLHAQGVWGPTRLTTQSGAANGINDAGQIVGQAYTGGSPHAYLRTAAGGMIDSIFTGRIV